MEIHGSRKREVSPKTQKTKVFIKLSQIVRTRTLWNEEHTEYLLFSNPKVILTPHIAASTAEAQIVVAEMIANQICKFLLKGVKINTV